MFVALHLAVFKLSTDDFDENRKANIPDADTDADAVLNECKSVSERITSLATCILELGSIGDFGSVALLLSKGDGKTWSVLIS
jgi:hypothetical protein